MGRPCAIWALDDDDQDDDQEYSNLSDVIDQSIDYNPTYNDDSD